MTDEQRPSPEGLHAQKMREIQVENEEIQDLIAARVVKAETERDALRAEVAELLATVKQYDEMVPVEEAERDELRAEVERLKGLQGLYDELKGCKWIRTDGEENKLAVLMANLERTLESGPSSS